MTIEVSVSNKNINAEIELPSSKSISNRALIIQALCGNQFDIFNLSPAADTIQLIEILKLNNNEVNAGDGGTTLRFLLSYYCTTKKNIILTASHAMKKRPVAPLVDALRFMGAKIGYIETEGKLPVQIQPSVFTGNSVAISGEISSQFVSALMLIGPTIKGGLIIEITGEVLSLPYILMTKSVMEYFGAVVEYDQNIISVKEGKYAPKDFTVEPDWSAASYWYEIAALSDSCEIMLKGLMKQSLQGDSAIAVMMEKLGVKTTFSEKGALLSKIPGFTLPDYFTDDYSGCPDLGPAIANTCAALNITADFTGLKNFRLKESDRAAAIQRELYNINVKSDFCGGSKLKIYRGNGIRRWNRPVKTYHDHRIAMAFAPLALKTGTVIIEDAEVVNKSYPGYFDDLKKAGFTLNVI